jgi:hypothetical protein
MLKLLLEMELLLVKGVRLLCGCYGSPSCIKCGEGQSGPRPFKGQTKHTQPG